ncbi:hypothetical protein [Pollutibacter soli]|uniref:hypothetical protein n=1 Tax=Pollutibacter soli TaxID=3034157 RepID=UPI003013B7F1
MNRRSSNLSLNQRQAYQGWIIPTPGFIDQQKNSRLWNNNMYQLTQRKNRHQ